MTKRYIYNIYSGSYDCPVFECQMKLNYFAGSCLHLHGGKTRPDAFMYFVKEVDEA